MLDLIVVIAKEWRLIQENYYLHTLLKRYLDDAAGLDTVREFVTARVGTVDDELIDYVSMEIWYLDDGFLTEERLRARLEEFLKERSKLPV